MGRNSRGKLVSLLYQLYIYNILVIIRGGGIGYTDRFCPGSTVCPRNSDPFYIIVLIIDGCSFHDAHTWNKSGISICWRHLVTSIESSNPIFLFGKRPCLHHTCATWNEQPSNIKTMKSRILYPLYWQLFERVCFALVPPTAWLILKPVVLTYAWNTKTQGTYIRL